MTWHDKQLVVRQHARLQREALAASVEEMSPHNLLELDEWDEEDALPSQKTSLVPPRLRLQSRQVPTVGTKLTQAIPVPQEQIPPVTNPVELPRAVGQGQRLGGRSTRVHLQAVRPDQMPEVSTERLSVIDPSGQQDNFRPATPLRPLKSASSTRLSESTASAHSWPRLLGGRGIIRRDQEVVTVPNAAITERSVVHVMLTGNPGPVVVQYISLHPRMGFTVHLSAPAAADTPFNYAVWPF